MENERELLICELIDVVDDLLQYINPALIPNTGANIGYALRKARIPSEVASVSGGIFFREGKVVRSGSVLFGADNEISRLILTAMKFEPGIRCVANLFFHDTALSVCEDLLYEITELENENELPGISIMDWGVAFAAKDGIPDVIYSRGRTGRPPVFRLFGENPTEVRTKIIKISQHMDKDNFGGKINGN